MLRQKIVYIHNNPIRRGHVDIHEHWRYSSARNYECGDQSVLEIVHYPGRRGKENEIQFQEQLRYEVQLRNEPKNHTPVQTHFQYVSFERLSRYWRGAIQAGAPAPFPEWSPLETCLP